ncbi:MAG TPA: sigma-E factor regulatory protein RseB domain-containing protein [Symbiobacteriaceae bacterium]|nr:sigma-E factor regulatory protein RseB domain-containing protein [Symbiobacteriaceae bacterium]
MREELSRELEAAVPADLDLWPKIQERLAQRQPAPAAVVKPSRKRWPLGVAAAAAVLAVGIGLGSAMWARPVSAQAIMSKAQDAMASPVGERFKTLALHETVTYAEGTTEIDRWYDAPNRWRVEVRSGGKLQNVAVSDGTTMWRYDPQQKSVTISEAARDYSSLAGISPLGEEVAGLADLLEQASRCYSPQVAGSATVAGRAAYVIDLKQTSCFSASVPNQGGQQTLWVDKETYMVLKAVVRESSGTVLETREVTRIAYDAPIPADAFTFAVPEGVTVWDTRPKPAPAGYQELVAQMQQFARDADYPLFLPRAVPTGLRAGAPMLTPAGLEIAYSATGTGAIEAGAVQMMQRRATSSDVGGHPPDEQPIQVGNYPGWFLQGHKEPDGTGLHNGLTVIRDGTRISFTSLDLGKEQLLAMALSLEPVPGSHAPLPNPVPPTLAELRAKVGHAILIPTQVPAGLKAGPPVGGDSPGDLVRITYVNAQGAVELDVLNGPAGCCLDGDGRKAGEPVTIRSGIEGHFIGNTPAAGGPILWWQEGGAYVALSGPHLTRDQLIAIANSMSDR